MSAGNAQNTTLTPTGQGVVWRVIVSDTMPK
nr:MAG TPA: hypothetical protein [Caudoviricetes sp.]